MRNINVLPFVCGLLFLLAALAAGAQEVSGLDPAQGKTEGETVWYDLRLLGLEGQGWTDVDQPYDRLPARAKGVVRDPVWGLSHHSAGLCARFVTTAQKIEVRWTLVNDNLAMRHMPATGVSGVDLYARAADGAWHWIGIGQPEKAANQATILNDPPEGAHEYLMYLPLYNGVTSVELGIPAGTPLCKAPARPEAKAKPVVFWGTSITQGGCAARPGMAYPAIIGRLLDRPTINLGFSGNGQMEPEMAQFLAELDPAAYVIDCAPNLEPGPIAERTEPVVRILREKHPDTPIVLVENITYQRSWFTKDGKGSHVDKNIALRAAYDRLLAAGVPGLYYVPGDKLLGDDFDATVDGTHPTDVGFVRIAEVLAPVLADILK